MDLIKHLEDTCLEEIELRAQHMLIIPGLIVNINERTYMTA